MCILFIHIGNELADPSSNLRQHVVQVCTYKKTFNTLDCFILSMLFIWTVLYIYLYYL